MIVLSMVIFSTVKAQSAVVSKESARIFVQKFYDWYAVMDADDNFTKKHNASAFSFTVHRHGEYFDIHLKNALMDYFHTPLKDDEMGLDFDPISAAQDTRTGFQTGNVTQLGNNFFVDVHDVKKGTIRKDILASPIAIVVEVAKVGSVWKIANFIYPAEGKSKQTNLQQLLINLQKEHAKYKSK